MRVISGSVRGRNLKAVPGMNTRPTTDKVKEAIFSMIGPYFEGGLVLDLFAGAGGLGIEAISRGMERGIFIDIERASVDVIKQNLQTTGLMDQAEIYRNSAEQALKVLHRRELKFDLIFVDPPYRMKNMDELLLHIEERSLLASEARVVLEHDARTLYAEQIGGFARIRKAEYGETTISIYEWKGI
ncbi:MAG: 16S rRNA (guanine(966)-N(2))-methyltransferase RsmD [Paenibacillaceae bacterium]